jgi:hypothetical protein
MTLRERVDSLRAAVRADDGVMFSLPRPARHGDVLHDLFRSQGSTVGAMQGFVDANGTFLTRQEAMQLALQAGLVLKVPNGPLFTEDLW